MSFPADAPFVSRPVPTFAAGLLALGVHALFALLLVFGLSWQTQPPAPVMVDLWDVLPAPQPAPEAPPEPPIQPEPIKVQPAPSPAVAEPPPVRTPDIALEKKKAEAELKAKQVAEEKSLAEAAAREKHLAEQKKREQLRQLEEADLMRRMADEEAANAARLTRLAEARAAASKRQAAMASVVGEYRDLISAKVRGNTRVPANLPGNPEVRCRVKLLPTGEVQSVQVTRSSGNPAYDDAVVRAIEKSSPLPLPADSDARAEFVPELLFVHRAKD